MVSSPSQHLLITTIDDSIAKVNITDGYAVYRHKDLFSLAPFTSESDLLFYCKPKQMEISSEEKTGSYHLNWLELFI